MRKTAFLSIITVLIFFYSVNVQSAVVYSFHDGTSDYALMGTLGGYAGNSIFTISVNYGAADGLLFWDPVYSALKIVVFENSSVWGWTLEGHWTGDGSSFTFVTNNGGVDQRNLYLVTTMIN